MSFSKLLCTKEAATVLGISPRTLEQWRCEGGGPIFTKLGKRMVRYSEEALQRFIFEGVQMNTAITGPESCVSTLLPRTDP